MVLKSVFGIERWERVLSNGGCSYFISVSVKVLVIWGMGRVFISRRRGEGKEMGGENMNWGVVY